MLEALKLRARSLKTELWALYLAYRHPLTPWYAKVWAAVVVGYAFSPVDLIPDFIPLLGYLDDLILVPLGTWLVLKLVPVAVMTECREQARNMEGSRKPRSPIAAVIIILIWIILAVICMLWVIRRFQADSVTESAGVEIFYDMITASNL